MRTREQIIKEAEQIVSFLYTMQSIKEHKPESWTLSMQDNMDRQITRLDTLNWVLGADRIEP